MNTIAITNQKGGVGKTTTAVNLAYYLAKNHEARVLLVDFDPQGNASSGLDIDKASLRTTENPGGRPTILEVVSGQAELAEVVIATKFKNLSIAPSNSQLADAEVGLSTVEGRFTRLRDALRMVADSYDIIIIDSPPSLSLLTLNALAAADSVLLPTQPEFFAIEGLTQLLETMALVRKSINPTLGLLGVLVTMMDKRTALNQQAYLEVAKYFPGKIIEPAIPRNVRLAEAPSHGLPVGAYDRFSKGARAYKAVAKEVAKRIGWAS